MNLPCATGQVECRCEMILLDLIIAENGIRFEKVQGDTVTYWSMKRLIWCMQSSAYLLPISWCECHARSMSSVGTKNDDGEVVIRSKNLESCRQQGRYF